jgi:hypothetical protein
MFHRFKVRGGNWILVTLVSADNIIGAFGQAREEMEKCEVNLVSIVKVGLRKHNPLARFLCGRGPYGHGDYHLQRFFFVPAPAGLEESQKLLWRVTAIEQEIKHIQLSCALS